MLLLGAVLMHYITHLWSCIKNTLCPPKENKTQYVNLAATSNADKDGIYSDALNFAINDPDVYNIGLTGPYGSGKSSIIKTFVKRYSSKRVLEISLAAFSTETKTFKKIF